MKINDKNSARKLPAIDKAIAALSGQLRQCRICPRNCGVDRTDNRKGYCRTGLKARVYSHAPHHGEEPPISGTAGSGTIFFSGCNMKCVYCQNHLFSQQESGTEVGDEELAGMMLQLQEAGCHNINLVTPSHVVPQILSALKLAVKDGLTIPIVYNTSGYDCPDTIKHLSGIVDVYMPDMRYSNDETASKYSDADRYVEYNRKCLIEMQSQVGDLRIDSKGIATGGLIIRLLVLPEDASGTSQSLSFIRHDISKNAHLSIMSQYRPVCRAHDFIEINRPVSADEYKNIVDAAAALGLNKGWVQEFPDDRFLGTKIRPGKEIK